MDDIVIPLIIRGRIIEDSLLPYDARGGKLAFRAPDTKSHIGALPLSDPGDLADLYRLPMDDIIDYLLALGRRLDLHGNVHVKTALEMALQANAQTRPMATAVFEAMPHILDRNTIVEFIERNIGMRYLEGWVEDDYSDRHVAVRAFGARTVHIIAGNVPVVALLTVLMNAVTRSDAIIKIPSNDPYTAIAIARTMIDMAPDHPLTRHLSVGYWKGGDEEMERQLYTARNVDKIVAWGGFSSMRSIRNYLAPGIDLVAMDPKISGSIIGPEAFTSDATLRAVAENAAWDIGHYNQSGCASARCLYVISGTGEEGVAKAARFGRLVYEALQALPAHISSAHPAFSAALRSELEGIRYSDAFRVIGGKSNEGAVVVSQADEEVDFSAQLDCRVANVIPVDDVEAAIRHVTVQMQTIGVYPDSLKSVVRDRCALRGAQRIVSLGHATSATFVGPWDAMEPMRRMVRWLRDDTMARRAGYLHGTDAAAE